MDQRELTFLPFPHVYKGVRYPGLTHDWPDPCRRCDRQCESASEPDVGLCTYGVNFLRISDDLLVAGVIVREYPSSSKQRSRMLKRVRSDAIPIATLRAVKSRSTKVDQAFASEVESAKAAIMNEYRQTEAYKADLVELLRPSLQQAFAQVHDYRQLTTQIIQNVNVVLQKSFPGKPFDEQLESTSQPLRSIYWAARLMEFKLEAALYLVYPERIRDPQKVRAVRLHGAITKYLSIYEPQMRAHRITHHQTGQSVGQVFANPDALGVIPHAFIDNAIKYAPDGSDVFLEFSEDASTITFAMRSLGPKITPEELGHIFDLFFRGEAARHAADDGTGFGLGLAEHVASEIGAKLSVSQDPRPDRPDFYWTTFSAQFSRQRGDDPSSGLYRARQRTRGGVPI